MDDVTRTEYPSMLAHLQPQQAVDTLNGRVRRISKVNMDIAEWMQERRRVEEQYVQSLKRLCMMKICNQASELGVFREPWDRIVDSIENLAASHHDISLRIERDVEGPLRSFHQRPDYTNMSSISANLGDMARELVDAQDRSDKLTKKGAKASTLKVDEAVAKLESSQQQWDSTAPFVFETLQALDESRVNQLRDLLTQYHTLESAHAQRIIKTSEIALVLTSNINTQEEIESFQTKTIASRPKLPPTQSSSRQQSFAPPSPPPAPASFTEASFKPQPARTGAETGLTSQRTQTPPTSQQTADEDSEQLSQLPEPKQGKLRRLGTMFGGRRRQSMYGAPGASPQKKPQSTFGRLGSSHGRTGVSPRPSSSNLQESNRLGALPETTATESATKSGQGAKVKAHDGTIVNLMDAPMPPPTAVDVNGTNSSDAAATATPPTASAATMADRDMPSPEKDAEGFTIPAPANDPISEAQKEAAGEEADQLFKLNIKNQPLAEEDPHEKEAALHSVANSLKMGPATRRAGTVRGRRDVRNTIYVPSPTSETSGEGSMGGMGGMGGMGSLAAIPSSPSYPASASKPTGMTALTSEGSFAASDTQSVRSGHSFGSLAYVRHPDLSGAGLQASIVETVSAVFEGGLIQSASIAGEIALVYNASDDENAKSHETIRINNFPNLERIGPNRIFVQNATPEQPDQFNLDLSHLTRTSTAFSYRVFADQTEPSTLGQHAPLLVIPAWKPQGDKLGLLLQYQLNPAFAPFASSSAEVTLHNVAFVVTYEGNASGAQTKPSGTHLREKHLVYWRLGDVTLTGETQKIVCRIIGAEGEEPKPGKVEARWEYAIPLAATPTDADEAVTTAAAENIPGSGISLSRLQDRKGKGREDDPFADEDAVAAAAAVAGEQKWVDIPVVRKLVGGAYEGR